MDRASTRLYPPEEYARRMDEAKARAVRARDEAVDAFWQGVIAAVRRAWQRRAPVPRRMRIRFG